MVRKRQMKTKHGIVLTSIIRTQELPFQNMPNDLILTVAPHQFAFNSKKRLRRPKVGRRTIDADCVCVNGSTQESLNVILSASAKNTNSMIWLDPAQIPTKCLATILTKWLWKVPITANIGLGLIISLSESDVSNVNKGDFEAWAGSIEGTIEKKISDITRPIWYPSLSRETRFLEAITEELEPFDIFPVVDFPKIIDYATERELAAHQHLLDHNRSRTRNFIYLNTESPEESLISLFESFQAIPRKGMTPRSLVITPGVASISYLISLLAGIFAEGIFITSRREIPCIKNENLWGFAVFKKSE